MAKINVTNVILIIGVTVFNMAVGLYDRLVNGVGVIDSLLKLAAAANNSAVAITWKTTDISMVTNVGSSFNFMALGAFIIVAVIIIGGLAGVMGRSAGME